MTLIGCILWPSLFKNNYGTIRFRHFLEYLVTVIEATNPAFLCRLLKKSHIIAVGT